jgi:hypothetical protein
LTIYRVWPDNITGLWPQVAPLLQLALDQTSTHTAEDVRRMLMSGAAQLWVQIEDGIVQAAMTTEFVNYPQGLFVRAWSAGARRDCKMQIDEFIAMATDWCLLHGGIGLEAVGRHGWLRKLPAARVEGLVMRYLIPQIHK